MASYASGKYALGICDKTGFQYKLKDLRYEYVNGVRTGRRVGYDVLDPDHPQNHIGEVDTTDPQSLRDPRPPTNNDRGLFGWRPVGNPADFMQSFTGKVQVNIS